MDFDEEVVPVFGRIESSQVQVVLKERVRSVGHCLRGSRVWSGCKCCKLAPTQTCEICKAS